MPETASNRNTIALAEPARVKRIFTISFVAIAVVGSFLYLQVNIREAFMAFPDFIAFFTSNFLPPDFSKTATYLPLIINTVMFAVVGTYLSAFLSLFFGLLMSEQMNKITWLRGTVRFIMSFLRNVPVLVWASLFVYIFGIGNMVGLIALVFATLGFLSRSYAESINQIAGAKLESLRASGAGYMQIFFHGLLPEFVPSWLNWTLFSFEINIRASAILGMVGAGGIGIMIQTNLRLFKYQEALSLILILVAIILLTELTTNKLRKIIR